MHSEFLAGHWWPDGNIWIRRITVTALQFSLWSASCATDNVLQCSFKKFIFIPEEQINNVGWRKHHEDIIAVEKMCIVLNSNSLDHKKFSTCASGVLGKKSFLWALPRHFNASSVAYSMSGSGVALQQLALDCDVWLSPSSLEGTDFIVWCDLWCQRWSAHALSSSPLIIDCKCTMMHHTCHGMASHTRSHLQMDAHLTMQEWMSSCCSALNSNCCSQQQI